jgi:hypothetical protein
VLPWALPHEVGGFARGLAVRHLNAGNYVGHCRTPIPVSAILPDAWNGSSYSLWERCAPPDHKTVPRLTILRGPSGMADLPIHPRSRSKDATGCTDLPRDPEGHRDGAAHLGVRLPSWRDLAAQLGVSRGTMRAACRRSIDAEFAHLRSRGPVDCGGAGDVPRSAW